MFACFFRENKKKSDKMRITKNYVKRKIHNADRYIIAFAKWVLIAFSIGGIGGLVGSLFHMAVNFATGFREENPFMLYLLPLGGVVIVFLYKICKVGEETGTNLIISSVRDNSKVPILMAPLIFVSTVITHIMGGSAGREGAALQLGGSIGAKAGEILKLDEKDMSLAIMCGMSGVFSALFGTPITAAFFAMEVISVGEIYYVGLVPCIASSLVAYKISLLMGLPPTRFEMSGVPTFNFVPLIKTAALAVLCALVSMLFCIVMKSTHKFFAEKIKNSYLRAVAGGLAIIALTFIVGSRDYNGAGGEIITAAIEEGRASPFAFLLKILFTAITIGSGFKGGEIVPTFFIGSTFGCFAGELLGLSPGFGAAIGLAATFCGVVNCPGAAIFLSLELFGGQGLIFFSVACAISYMLSGYYGLYSEQKIIYSKIKPKYINIHAK